jgi:hypothetical protein
MYPDQQSGHREIQLAKRLIPSQTSRPRPPKQSVRGRFYGDVGVSRHRRINIPQTVYGGVFVVVIVLGC